MELPDASSIVTGQLHWNDMVINTYKINQIHVTFYWVSEYKPRYYQYGIIVSYAHLADDDGMPNLLVTVIAYKHTDCISFLRISVDLYFGVSISVDISCVCELHKFCSPLQICRSFVSWNGNPHAYCSQDMFFL